MRMSQIAVLSVLFVGFGMVAPLNADFVEFKVPTTNVSFVLQGKANVKPRHPVVTFNHVGKLTFDLPKDGAKVHECESLKELGMKKLKDAKGKEAELMDATVWVLDHGQLIEFHRSLEQLLQANSSHAFGTRAKQLKEELGKVIPDDPQAEVALQKLAGDAKIIKTAHFLLLAPPAVAEKGASKRKKPEARGEQLEQLLEVFVMKCAERGLPVQVPTTRLSVALIASPPSSNDTGLRTRPRDAAIHWSPSQNLLFINDAVKVESLVPVRNLEEKLEGFAATPKKKRNPQGQGRQGAGAPPPSSNTGMGQGGAGITLETFKTMSTENLQKFVITAQSLIAIGTENHELESISREAAYYFSDRCGVLAKSTPAWVRDGFATYFELPADYGWVKIGDVSRYRQGWYSASLEDSERISMKDIVCGNCYEQPMSPNDVSRATTLSWSLIHFLLEKHPEGIMKFTSGIQWEFSMTPLAAIVRGWRKVGGSTCRA
jgi:hypothetical protein